MRMLAILLVAIVISGLSFGTGCEELVLPYLEQGEGHAYLNVPIGGYGQYILFSIANKYSLLANCSLEPSLVEDYPSIEYVLGAYAKEHSAAIITPDSEWKGRMVELLSKFEASRAKEAECKRYIGLDQVPCHDRPSCIKACYTPLCSPQKEGNECSDASTSCGFVDSIVSLANNFTLMDNAAAELKALLAGIETVDGPEALARGAILADRMIEAANSANSNNLMNERIYYFCPRAQYDTASLGSLRAELDSLRGKYALLVKPGATAREVAEETKRRIELWKNKSLCSENVNYTKRAIAEIASEHPASGYSEVMAPLSKMRSYSAELEGLCNARKFAETGGAMNRFSEEEGNARAAFLNVSVEYDAVKRLYGEVAQEIAMLPPEANLTALQESMVLVDRELSSVSNYADLMILKEVLLGNRKQVEKTQEPQPGLLEQFGIPLAIAAFITLMLFALMKKRGRRGL